MMAAMCGGLMMQALAVVLLRHRLGRPWLRHPVSLLVLASVMYQGISPLLLAMPSVSAWDIYQKGVQTPYVSNAVFLLSAGVLALTIAYLLGQPQRAVHSAHDPAVWVTEALDWRILTAACAPLAVLTYEGRGYNSTQSASLSVNLAATFFVILVALAATAFVLRHGGRWFLPVMIAQSVLLAAAGERTPVITDALALVLLLASAGMRPSSKQLTGAAAMTILAALAITLVRAEQGRTLYYQDNGLAARVKALGSGLVPGATPPQPDTPGLLAQAATRMDGVSFTAGILQAEHLGVPRLNPVGVPESLLIAIPSFTWPSKLAHEGVLQPDPLEVEAFGLQHVNFLPGLPGLYTGFLSPAWLVIFMAFLGIVAAWGERWLFKELSPVRLVLLAGAITAALGYERGLQGMVLDLRTAVAIALIVKVIEVMRARRRSHSPVSLPVVPSSLGQILDY